MSDRGEQDYEEEFFANVRVLPWRHYQFYVSAVNQLGESDLSEPASAAECITPPWRPKRNPRGVCSSLRASRQLVIVWQVSVACPTVSFLSLTLSVHTFIAKGPHS